ncbi:MAG TPA: isoprenylcysteine carboxylmethyltransferase family protein [Bdellovibrionota bacterium]|nr:isoprenylcysteine carboxylmethyltransferase family protein [Bdellovibrionota bacterium]
MFNLLTFALTSRGFSFQKDTENPRGFRTIKTFFTLNFFLQLYLVYAHVPSESFVPETIGWIVQTASAALFWWTRRVNHQRPLTLAYHTDTPTHLNRSGPYRFIRHPFYTAYIMAPLACAMYTLSPLSLVAALINYWLYNRAAAFEENKFTQSALSSDYELFKTQAGRFWPKLF